MSKKAIRKKPIEAGEYSIIPLNYLTMEMENRMICSFTISNRVSSAKSFFLISSSCASFLVMELPYA